MGVINLGVLVKNIMSKISGAGYVKDTDYATSSKGGTIKVDSTYALDITDAGKLKAKEITHANYAAANAAAFISKKTLDNILAAGGTGTWTHEDMGNLTQGTKKTFTDMETALSCKKLLINSYTGETVVGSVMLDLDLMRAALGETGYADLTAIKTVIATATSSTTITVEDDGLTIQGGGYIVIYFYQ